MINIQKSSKNSNDKLNGGNKRLNKLQLYFALTIAGILGVSENTFAQKNNSINHEYKINKISLSEYKDMIQRRNIGFSKMDASLMDPKEYFVYSQKMMFLKSTKTNRYNIKDLMTKVRVILKTKFKQDISNDPTEILETALDMISNFKDTKGLAIFSSKIDGDFDQNMVDAVGYIQSLAPELWQEIDGDKMPTWRLDYNTLQFIVSLLNKGEYIISFEKAKERVEKKDKPLDVKIKDDKKNKEKKLIKNDDGPLNIKSGKKEKIEKKDKPIDVKIEDDKKIKDKIYIEDEDKPLNIKSGKKEKIEKKDKPLDVKIEDDKKIDKNHLENYNFKKRLNPDLGIEKVKQEIDTLVNNYTVIRDFVQRLKKIDINFDRGDDISISQTAIVLELVDNDFEAGNIALDKTISDGLTGTGAIIRGINKNLLDKNKVKKKIVKVEDVKVEEDVGINLGITEDMLIDDNLKIVNNLTWTADLLSKELNKNKLNGITYQQIIDVVDGFKSDELKKIFMYALLNDNIVAAQELMGMSINCDYRYKNYIANQRIGISELNKIKKLGVIRKYIGKNDIMINKHIPQDVKNAYTKFVNGALNNKGRPYSIISKIDMKIYMFSKDHRLLSRQNTLIGSHKGDYKNNPYKGSRTTPGGLYEIGRKFEKNTKTGKSFFSKYGTHYIILIPLEGQYTLNDNYSMGIHGTYDGDASRDRKIESSNAADHKATNGCVNTKDEEFGEIYNHVTTGDIVYIAFEPSNQDIQNFKNAGR